MQTSGHLFLIGFMGCGKTHWGRLLAEKLDWPFLDLDVQIASSAGKSIPEIFAETGESGFRQLEHDALRMLAGLSPTVVATGGGTPCFFDNMDWMNAHGKTVYLQLRPTLLAERLRSEKNIRPLLFAVNDVDLQIFIENKLKDREPFYLQATAVVEENEAEHLFLERLVNILPNP